MTELVVMEKKIIWTDSRIIADHFAKSDHYRVKRIISQVIDDYEIKGDLKSGLNLEEEPCIIPKNGEYRNQKFEYFLINKPAFILLAMRFRTKEALKWQLEFVKAFSKMEKAIARQNDQQWIESRKQGKLARKQETDIIKEYVDYATNQGSKNANMYYIHLTKATYKALGLLQHNKPSTRNMLDTFQINQLFMAEVVVTNSLRKYMAMEVHYKKIFQLVKDDLDSYAGLIDMTGIKQLRVGS